MIKPYGYVRKDGVGPFIFDERENQGAELMPVYTKDVLLQAIKELRPAILPLEGMGRGKTTQEWFDILAKHIQEMKK